MRFNKVSAPSTVAAPPIVSSPAHAGQAAQQLPPADAPRKDVKPPHEWVKWNSALYVIQTTGAVEYPCGAQRTATGSKIWIYPAKAVANNKLTANGAAIYVGKDASGIQQVCTDPLNPGDNPILYKIPLDEEGRQRRMLLRDVIITGTAGDGVFIVWI